MAEETPTTSTPQEQLPTLPDSIFEELEKVAQIEKDIRFLQLRQGSVENSVTTLREVVEAKTATSEDPKQVISEETKDIPEEDDKNKVKDDKLKSSLESSEKKRYENIGVEFAKGASKIFNELEKAQRLKERMQSSKFKKEEEKQEEVKKEEKKKKKFSLKTLALAIAAVAAIMYTMRDKIDEFIPGFKNGAEGTFGWIKEKVSGIFGDVIDSITSIFNTIFGDIFTGSGGVKSTLNSFFLDVLPDIMYQSGLALFSAFGASVDDEHKTMMHGEEAAVRRAGRDGQELARREEEERKRSLELAQANGATLTDVFASSAQLEAARRTQGRDALIVHGLGDEVAALFGVEEKMVRDMASYGNNFATFLSNNAEIINNQYNDEDSMKLAKLFYQQQFRKSPVDNNGQNTAEFREWYQNTWSRQVNSNNWSSMRQAAQEFQNRVNSSSTLEEDRRRLEEIQRQAANTARQNGLKYTEDGSGQVELSVKPAEIAQDIFAGQSSTLFNTIKDLFSGNVQIDNLVTESIKFVNEVIEHLISPLLTQFTTFENAIDSLIINQNQTNINQGGGGSGSGESQPIINMPKSDQPIILLDFELDSGLLTKFTDIFKAEGELITTMTATNEQLKTIKGMTIVKSTSSSTDVSNQQMSIVSGLQQRMGVCEEAIKVQDGRVSHIETYLEANDVEGDTTRDFVLQAQS